MASNSYDLVPYVSHPYPQTRPERLATIATLFGLRPVPVSRCRVLELGCCSGGNLIPMAEQLPKSDFVGIDSSARQIGDGQEIIRRLDLSNIKLLHKDILEVGGDLGKFDYIICHGVYSWVPREVQEKIMRICRENLSPQGIAYISYNTYPGWRMRGIIRDIMLYRARGIRVARRPCCAGPRAGRPPGKGRHWRGERLQHAPAQGAVSLPKTRERRDPHVCCKTILQWLVYFMSSLCSL